MRIIFGFLVIYFCLAGSGIVFAESGFSLDKVSLQSKYSEAEGEENQLLLKSSAVWDWLAVDLQNRFRYPEFDDKFSVFNLDFILPKITKDLKFQSGFRWNDNYEMSNGGFTYKLKPQSGLDIKLGYEKGSQEGLKKANQRFGCYWDWETARVDYETGQWDFGLDLERTAKVYPDAPYYTSLKWNLRQDTVWNSKKNFKAGYFYRESVGDYPESYHLDFWKSTVGFDLAGKAGAGRWTGKYTYTDWERGVLPFRKEYRISSEYWRSLRDCLTARIRLSLSDLAYYSQESAADPGDEEDDNYEEEDLKSRLESKIGIEFNWQFDKVSYEVDCFLGNYDYKASSVSDRLFTGVTASIDWEFKLFRVKLDLAPDGDRQTRKGYYKLLIDYKPGKRVRR